MWSRRWSRLWSRRIDGACQRQGPNGASAPKNRRESRSQRGANVRRRVRHRKRRDAADVTPPTTFCAKKHVPSVSSRKKKHLFTADSPISDALDISYCQTNFEETEEEEERRRRRKEGNRHQAAKRIDAIATELCFGEEKYARAIARELDDIRRRDDATSTTTMMMMDDDAFDDTKKKKNKNRGIFGAAAAAREEEDDDDENQTHYRAKKKDGRTMTRGRVYSKTFLEKTKRLYDMHMGAENMGPVLYSFCRFTKPENVLEIGAGYTSVFLLQAMRDNKEEIATYERMRKENSCTVKGDNGENTPWSNEAFFSRSRGMGMMVEEGVIVVRKTAYSPQLHVVDNMAHAYTTAHLVKECSQELNENTINVGDEKDVFLTVHEADAFHPDLSATLAPGVQFDFLWIDLGAANRIETFLQNFWFRVKPGGYVAVHSTLTNSLSREWLEKMRALARNGGKNEDGTMGEYGVFEIMSFMEPHKLFQNSFTIFQRRDQHPIDSKEYKEPVLTKYP